MEEKLRSILKRIHWSSLLRAVVFAAAWLYLPLWLFILIALYLYFIPVPQSGTVAGPFLVLLLLVLLEPPSILFAIVFGFVFFYILLIKDLILIDRKAAYEVTILFLVFLLFRDFYLREGGAVNAFSLLYSFFTALLVGFLLSNFIRVFKSHGTQGVWGRFFLRRTAIWLSTILIWQFLVAGLFLPVDFVYQALAAFLAAIVIVDLVPQYLFGESSRSKVLVTTSVVFVLFVLVLGSARWGL